jgi:diguanylate cyclase (GGDEF)-like protein
LNIDLKLRPSDLQKWWPEDAIQRELKHRFLTSGIVRPIEEQAEQIISIGHHIDAVPERVKWATRLYCGGELKHLIAYWSINQNSELPCSQIEMLCHTIKASTFLGNAEDSARLMSTLDQTDWQHCSADIQNLVFETRYIAHSWFHHFSEAVAVSRDYLIWSRQHGPAELTAYAHILHFTAECLTGAFSYKESELAILEQQLVDLKWSGLYNYLTSSYWFDHHYTLSYHQELIQNCKTALGYANDQKDLVSTARIQHYLGIIYQRTGQFDEALVCINKSIETSLNFKSTRRTYHALNGKAYILILLSRFEEALSSIEQAFALVVEDNNHEQICTTLCNVSLLALFSNHFSSAIKAIDEVFSTMLMRGIPRTRFRTNHELRGIQAIATLFAGDRAFALAIYKVSEPEPANTLEGIIIQKLMMIVQRFDTTSNDELAIMFNDLFNETAAMRNPLLALFIWRVQHQLMKTHTDRFTPNDTIAVQKRAIVFARNIELKNCIPWFSDQTEEAHYLSKRLTKLNATKVSKRESQIDLLRIENALLKLSLDIETQADRCEQPEDLFTYCLNKLYKSVAINYASIEILREGKLTYETRIGSESNGNRPAHHFSFFYQENEVRFTLDFEAKTEIFTDQLVKWTSRFVDQLDQVINKMVARKHSHKLAYKDHLTGLMNRAAFEEFFATTELSAGETISVGFIDLNRFKRINDEHGHQTGDSILTAFAQHLRHSIRATDLVYRIGGDEFFVVFQNAEASHIQPTLDTKLMAFFHGPRRKDDPFSHLYTQMGCSIGLLQITVRQPMKLDRKMIVAKADALMYRAKSRYDSAIEVDSITI